MGDRANTGARGLQQIDESVIVSQRLQAMWDLRSK
jgi:hypothetical protein